MGPARFHCATLLLMSERKFLKVRLEFNVRFCGVDVVRIDLFYSIEYAMDDLG
jgi:hypothetical protein